MMLNFLSFLSVFCVFIDLLFLTPLLIIAKLFLFLILFLHIDDHHHCPPLIAKKFLYLKLLYCLLQLY
jgi:hypothetical protein